MNRKLFECYYYYSRNMPTSESREYCGTIPSALVDISKDTLDTDAVAPTFDGMTLDDLENSHDLRVSRQGQREDLLRKISMAEERVVSKYKPRAPKPTSPKSAPTSFQDDLDF